MAYKEPPSVPLCFPSHLPSSLSKPAQKDMHIPSILYSPHCVSLYPPSLATHFASFPDQRAGLSFLLRASSNARCLAAFAGCRCSTFQSLGGTSSNLNRICLHFPEQLGSQHGVRHWMPVQRSDDRRVRESRWKRWREMMMKIERNKQKKRDTNTQFRVLSVRLRVMQAMKKAVSLPKRSGASLIRSFCKLRLQRFVFFLSLLPFLFIFFNLCLELGFPLLETLNIRLGRCLLLLFGCNA